MKWFTCLALILALLFVPAYDDGSPTAGGVESYEEFDSILVHNEKFRSHLPITNTTYHRIIMSLNDGAYGSLNAVNALSDIPFNFADVDSIHFDSLYIAFDEPLSDSIRFDSLRVNFRILTAGVISDDPAWGNCNGWKHRNGEGSKSMSVSINHTVTVIPFFINRIGLYMYNWDPLAVADDLSMYTFLFTGIIYR